MKVRITWDVDDETAVKLEQWDRAVFDLAGRCGLNRPGQTFTHEPKRVLEAFIFGEVARIDELIAATDAKKRP